tara:strand:- start:7774 stop:8106 length:333 start_codon:yes stop_codon:yes gene_type:complete
MRMNISLTDDLRAQMTEIKNVNWSQIASAAFETHISKTNRFKLDFVFDSGNTFDVYRKKTEHIGIVIVNTKNEDGYESGFFCKEERSLDIKELKAIIAFMEDKQDQLKAK